MNPIGICRLCLKERELKNSHFISKAAYKHLLGGDGKNQNPYLVNEQLSVQTSNQITAHAFCAECEDRFNKCGETTFFQYCYQSDGTFRLLDELRKMPPIEENKTHIVYRVPDSLSNIIPQLAYFGTSIFGRSAAFPWKLRGKLIDGIQLGKRYQEEFRKFLLHEDSFPTNAALVIELSVENNRLVNLFNTPSRTNEAGIHQYWFFIAGFHFRLFVGARIPSDARLLSIYRPDEQLLPVAKNKEAYMGNMLLTHLKKSS